MLDSDGRRRRFKLDIMNLHETGLTKVGMWNPDDGFDDLRLMNELKIKHFNILITMVTVFRTTAVLIRVLTPVVIAYQKKTFGS